MYDLSLIICTHNNSQQLRETLAAIAAQSPPTGVKIEMLVVDNNCTDDTASIVETFSDAHRFCHVRLIRESKQGLTYARQCGAVHSQAEWIAFVDDDCVLDPDWVGQALGFARQNPQCGAFGGCVVLDYETPPPAYHRRFCLRTHIGRGTRDNPGLMLGLEAGGSCTGLAYRIAADAVDQETWVLWKREMIVGSYSPRWVVVDGAGPNRRAITFVMNKAHHLYAGRLPRSEVVRTLATAEGDLGRSCDYLYEIIAELASFGIHDRGLVSIARNVRAQQRDARVGRV